MTGTGASGRGVGLGWGVVGTGDISRFLVGDLRSLASARRTAVASRDLSRARAFADEFGFDRAHGDVDDLLRDAAVDIVYLGTPHSTHSALAIRALEAGKHVLVEKPLGVNAADVARVVDAARAADRFAMEAMWMRFHPYYRAALAEARAGAIGEVRSIRASFGVPFGAPDSTRWSAPLASSTLLDQGIYPVTLAYDLFGVPSSITAQSRRRADGVDLTDIATLAFDGGRVAQVAASMVEFIDPSAAINGTEGWLEVPAPFWATDRYTRHVGSVGDALMAPHAATFVREGMGYVPMLRAVQDAVLDGLTEHPFHPLGDSLAIARILDDIRTTASHAPNLETAS
jgi:predicted dehydrogenase